MPTVRITKEFTFEAAHLLNGYDGLCANIHGHSYRLRVTLRGEPCTDTASPKCGMLFDFSLLKSLVNAAVIAQLDHALMVREGSWDTLETISQRVRVVFFPFQPTCENLIAWMVEQISPQLPGGVGLFSLRLYETATSYAEWFADDQH